MNILTFDTSLDKTYVTFSSGEKILATEVIENHNEKYHSAFLIPVIVQILKQNNLTMQDVNAIGTNVGPGSFTGIRACVTVARVFAQQLKVPLVGVSSLEILSCLDESSSRTIVVLDARKNQFYTAVYENGKELCAPKLTDSQEVLSLDFSDSSVIADSASNKFLKENEIDSVVYNEKENNLGLFLNKIVQNKLSASNSDEFVWAKLKPLYLQTPPISVSAKTKV